jgi:(p)ppGpp synthase/HD superfamily hydrolase
MDGYGNSKASRSTSEMATLELAVRIAAQAHEGQKDKQGHPYLLHPLRVMMNVEGEPAQVVAVLHDVVEDTAVTIDQVRAQGFADAVIEALQLVTHAKGQPYADYVVRCKANEIARQVKLADLQDNTQLPRCLLRQERFQTDSARLHRYILSYKFLTDQIDEDQYRRMMADFEA